MQTETILANARALRPQIEAAASEIAAERRLPDALVDALRQAGVFRIAFPKAWGGPEMAPLDQCALIETLAYNDASVAWVAMICSDSGHYAARLSEPTAHRLYPDLDALTAGLLYPAGQARPVDGGYRVCGRWQFGSGSLHADHIVGGCLVLDDDAIAFDETGMPRMLVAYLPRAEVTIHDTWHTLGLAGSGSNDYSVDDVFVPADETFHAFRVGERPETLYRYHGFFFVNLPAVAIGCARRMLDDLRALAVDKMLFPEMRLMRDEYRVQIALAEATAKIGAAKAYQDQSIGDLWETLLRGDEPTLDQRAAISLMSVHAIQQCHAAAEQICEAVGSSAIYATSPFERRRRDLATITAHIIGQRKGLTGAAQLLFGTVPPTSFV